MKADAGCVEEIAATVLRWIATRPNAGDTVDGICEWWLPQQRYLDSRANVLAALQLLEARGQIEARRGLDGQVLYRARGSDDS
jgi:hypothetical protein